MKTINLALAISFLFNGSVFAQTSKSQSSLSTSISKRCAVIAAKHEVKSEALDTLSKAKFELESLQKNLAVSEGTKSDAKTVVTLSGAVAAAFSAGWYLRGKIGGDIVADLSPQARRNRTITTVAVITVGAIALYIAGRWLYFSDVQVDEVKTKIVSKQNELLVSQYRYENQARALGCI